MKTFICTICGYVFTGKKPPEFCPQCKAPASKFNEMVENRRWIVNLQTNTVIGVAKGCRP